MNKLFNRREMAKYTGLVALTSLFGGVIAYAKELKSVKSKDGTLVPMAKGLAYKEKDVPEAKQCTKCNFYQGGDKPEGGCTVLPGFKVSATASCSAFSPKS